MKHRRRGELSRLIPRWTVVVLAAAAVALAAAACGSSSPSKTTSTPTSSSTPATTTPGISGSADAGITNYQTYTDGKAGAANPKLSPVQIGWVNQQGGQVVIGGLATAGAQFAVKYINQQLGGIDGHPLKLDTCFIANSEQQGTTCGQQFVANKSMPVVDEGAVATGISPLYSTIAGKKPVIVGVSVTPVDSVQKNAVILFGDVTHVLGPFGTYAKEVLHAKTAALVYPNEPGDTDAGAAIKAGLEAAGVTVKSVAYDPNQTDLVGALTSAGAATADMVIPYSEASGCVSLAKGLQQLGVTNPKKIVSAPLCLSAPVKQALGDYPKWTYAIASSLFGDPTDPGMPLYMKLVQKYGMVTDAPDPWFIVSFAQILTTARFLNEVGYANLSPAAVQAKAMTFTGPVALGAPSLKCGEYPQAPAVCNNKAQFFQYSGDNKWAKVAGWLEPPPGA